jgi:hypothetical protein
MDKKGLEQIDKLSLRGRKWVNTEHGWVERNKEEGSSKNVGNSG